MRHRMRGRKLGRNSSHRKAMFRNMACSLIRSLQVDEDEPNAPKVPGRIITTVPKAKELRPIIEKLITLARKAIPHAEKAKELKTTAERNSDEWRTWRKSDQWQQWAAAVAPAVALRRRAFAKLRDKEAVDILFSELAERFQERPGGYTRVIQLATVRLGDAGKQAMIEFVGERDRVKSKKRSAPVVTEEDDTSTNDAPSTVEVSETEETAESVETTTEETVETAAE
ncbi:LSU ribosomal protein L17p [hydrothermal vent metagenome]|uniref:LSU ribosomal protein L17p n=1 Tax=hydrothermal vent metagenome TaxID=652676 RepID=A0A3B1DFQ6_9ZZZZ